MPLSDTQRLIATLELQDKFSGTAGRANRSLGDLEGRLGRTGRSLGVFGHAAGTALGIGLERAISGGVRLLTSAITGGVEALNQLESSMVATETVIASTQGVAGQTAAEIREMSEAFESLNASVGDEVIQAGANMLLTFTNIREDAFEPALEAALNLNEAMGGGEEGLQATIIQVGKALNDPIQGVTALRRVGVQLSDQQEDQIKVLMEQNDLYGAQQIILGELTTQFGGRFAAAGKTAAGQQAALRDRIQDLQKALAGPLIPAIDKVRTRLITLFESPAAVAAATKLGDTIAGLFTEENLGHAVEFVEDGLARVAAFDFNKVGDGVQKVFGFLGEVPWGAIGEGLRITGAATKVVVDAFLALPKEVQGIAIAALAVNKLSGGLAGGLAGGLLGKGIDLFRGRGMTPVNPLFVQQVGLPGTGTPVGPGGAGGFGKLLLGVTGVGLAALLADEFEEEIEGFTETMRDAMFGEGNALINLPSGPSEWQWPFGAANPPDWLPDFLGGPGPDLSNPFNITPEEGRAKLSQFKGPAGSSGFGATELTALIGKIKSLTTLPDTAVLNKDSFAAVLPDTAMSPVTTALNSQKAELQLTRTDLTAKFAAGVSKQEQVAAAVRSQSGILAQIRDRSTAVTVKVQNNVQVGVSEIQYRIQSLTQTIGGGVTPTSPTPI